MSRVPLNERREWQALEEHYQKIRHLHLRDLFATDPKRGERLTAEAVGLYLDYSKHRITDDTLDLLVQLAASSPSWKALGSLRSHTTAQPMPSSAGTAGYGRDTHEARCAADVRLLIREPVRAYPNRTFQGPSAS